MTEKKKPGSITIEELLAEKANDLVYQSRWAEKQRRIAERHMFNFKSLAPLVDDLRAEGYQIESTDDVMTITSTYPESVEILYAHVDGCFSAHNTETIVRGLNVPAARGLANKKLLKMFPETDDDGLRWAIGLTLETIADSGDESAIRALLSERAYGGSRDRLIGALGRLEGEAAIPLIRSLLKQSEVCVEAINVLGDLRAVEAHDEVEALTKHEDSWVRKHARRALRKIDTRVKRLKAKAEKERLKESTENKKRSQRKK
jgi:hypothetical protein